MKVILSFTFFLFVNPTMCLSQSVFGSETSLVVSEGAQFYANGSIVTFDGNVTNNGKVVFPGVTVFNDTLTNSGTTILTGVATFNSSVTNEGKMEVQNNVDFVANKDLGNITFNGNADQTITSLDTLNFDSLVLAKEGRQVVNFESPVNVHNAIELNSGVIATTDNQEVLVAGEVSSNLLSSGSGYVYGDMTARLVNNQAEFPIFYEGIATRLKLSGSDNVEIKVTCHEVSRDSVAQNPAVKIDHTKIIAGNIEWEIESLIDTEIAIKELRYEDVNWTDRDTVRSHKYRIAVMQFNTEDSLYYPIKATSLSDNEVDYASALPTNKIISLDQTYSLEAGKSIRLNVGVIATIEKVEFFLPNVFSPNGFDEKNRIFRLFYNEATEIQNYDLRIFDSYRSSVFSESESGENLDLSSKGWDGLMPNGLDAPEGVYLYQVNINYKTNIDGVVSEEVQTFSQSGSVILVK